LKPERYPSPNAPRSSTVLQRPAEIRSLKVFLRQRQPRPLLVPEDAGNPEAPLGVHNLDRVDASREWLAIVLCVPALVCTPHVDEIAELLDAVRDASLEEAVRLK
jgi:hypothetical protein